VLIEGIPLLRFKLTGIYGWEVGVGRFNFLFAEKNSAAEDSSVEQKDTRTTAPPGSKRSASGERVQSVFRAGVRARGYLISRPTF
jgi:hypothetical protein